MPFFLSYFLLVIISIITHQFTLFMRQVLCYNTYNYILSEDSSSTWIFDTLKKHQCNQQSVLMCLQILQRFLIINRKLTRLLRQRPEARFRFTAGPLVSDDFIENWYLTILLFFLNFLLYYIFFWQIPPNTPSSVTLQQTPGEDGKVMWH